MKPQLRVLPTNQELVERRIQVAREKRQARDRSLQRNHEKNMRLKNMAETNDLFSIRVLVDQPLREEMRLSAKERRGRIFVQPDSNSTTSLRGLHKELQDFYRSLRKDSFFLTAALPNTTASDVDETLGKLSTDADVQAAFQAAQNHYQEHQQAFKRPTILVRIMRNYDANVTRNTAPSYLVDLPDPSLSSTITMLSFYSFPPSGIKEPEEFASTLRKVWKPFHALGRVYVAAEGVNAQMSVPTTVLDRFIDCCHSIEPIGSFIENGINIDPVPLSVDDFATAGVAAGKPEPPFTNLHVRVRRQIVADGLEKDLDWQSAGYDMPPLEWHERLKTRIGGSNPIILDCRNSYETDVGRFRGAEPLSTESFRETWDVLKNRLKDTPKDTPILGYCTGGIRCVKVGAYLTQELGFTNVSRLAGGIIAYDRTLKEKAPDEVSLFRGTNFVFDGRLSRPITKDALGTCFTCRSETAVVCNCRNESCHRRMMQCEQCNTSFLGTCSVACQMRLMNGLRQPEEEIVSDLKEETYSTLAEYSDGYSSPVPTALKEIELNTRHFFPSGAHMVSGGSQGRLLKQFASMTREGRVLELGTFTGFATAWLLQGSYEAAQSLEHPTQGSREAGPFVLTMERDSVATSLAVAHLEAICDQGPNTEMSAETVASLRSSSRMPRFQENHRVVSYRNTVGCEVHLVTDALASLESLAHGTSGDVAPFDIVFVDADKNRLFEYVDICLSSDCLKSGGLILVDNVLWKGLVLGSSSSDFSLSDDDSRNRRSRKLANAMHTFNKRIIEDPRVEVLVLPIRDGLSVIRKI